MQFYHYAFHLSSLELNQAGLFMSFFIQIYGYALILSSLEVNQAGLFFVFQHFLRLLTLLCCPSLPFDWLKTCWVFWSFT
jgi:hypothetical protein